MCCVCNCTRLRSSLSLDHVRYLLPISRPKPPAAASIPPLKVAPGVTRDRGQGRRHYTLPSVCSNILCWTPPIPTTNTHPHYPYTSLANTKHRLPPPPSLGNMCHPPVLSYSHMLDTFLTSFGGKPTTSEIYIIFNIKHPLPILA